MTHWLHSGEFYSILCAVIWAFAVIMFTRLGDTVPPVVLNLFKGAVAMALLPFTMLAFGSSFVPFGVPWQDYATLIVSGIIGISIADSLFFASLNRLGAGRNAIVDCLYSPFVVFCAWLALSEPVGPKLLIALGLMVSAIFVGTWNPEPDERPEAARERRLGVTYGALAMLLMAIGIVMAKPVLERPRTDLLWATTVRVSGATFFLFCQAMTPRYRAITRRVFTPGRHWILLAASGFVGTYLAMIVWLAGFKYTQASVSAILNQTSTLLTPLLAAVFLHEQLGWRKDLAIFMGFVGAALLNLDLVASWRWIGALLGG